MSDPACPDCGADSRSFEPHSRYCITRQSETAARPPEPAPPLDWLTEDSDDGSGICRLTRLKSHLAGNRNSKALIRREVLEALIAVAESAKVEALRAARAAGSGAPRLQQAVKEQMDQWLAKGDGYSAISCEEVAAALKQLLRDDGASVDVFGRLTLAPAPSPRVLELATMAAERLHDEDVMRFCTNGHRCDDETQMRPEDLGFSACPHPDCTLVREAVRR